MQRLGIFGRVFWGSVVVVLITALGVYFAAVPTIERSLEEDALKRVEHEAVWAAQLCAESFDSESASFRLDALEAVAAARSGTRFTLIRTDGKVLFDSQRDAAEMDNHATRSEILNPATAVTRYSRTIGLAMTYYALPVEVDGVLCAYSRVSVPVQARESRVEGLIAAIRKGVLLASIFSLALAWILARWVARPLKEVAGLVGELGKTQTTRRLIVRGDDEYGQLARAVNHMADELQSQVGRIGRDRIVREAILSALAGGLLAVDGERNILFINGKARTLLGAGQQPLKGKPVWELTRNQTMGDVIRKCLSDTLPTRAETRLESPKGSATVEIAAVPLADEVLGRSGCVLELRDVSELRRLEEMRRDFVSNVSHELKTPLTAMRGYLELLLGAKESEMTEGQRVSFLQKAHTNTERLAAIVSDLLSLTRIESPGTELDLESLDLAGLCRAVLGDLQDLADSKQAHLQLNVPDRGLIALTDSNALGMALTNLVTNAIQYSPDGKTVSVNLSVHEKDARIEVRDDGPGIPVDQQERIFERFYRIDKARSRNLGGTGLGLSIVRHVMGSLGGRVELQSRPGQGSCFTLILPGVVES